jgi:Leucine-rich repeat (LRR) protein
MLQRPKDDILTVSTLRAPVWRVAVWALLTAGCGGASEVHQTAELDPALPACAPSCDAGVSVVSQAIPPVISGAKPGSKPSGAVTATVLTGTPPKVSSLASNTPPIATSALVVFPTAATSSDAPDAGPPPSAALSAELDAGNMPPPSASVSTDVDAGNMPPPVPSISTSTSSAASVTVDAGSTCDERGVHPDDVNAQDDAGLEVLRGVVHFCGTLTIGQNVSDLSALSYLESVTNLSVLGNEVLTNLQGLSGLTAVSNLTISGNTELTNLNGLEGITNADRVLIAYNQQLVDLLGLHSLRTAGRIEVTRNDALTSLLGLRGLRHVVDSELIIRSNPLLENLDGLESLTSIAGALFIEFNPALIDILGLSQLTSVDQVGIAGNDALLSLVGLDRVASVDWSSYVSSNLALTDLDGLNGLRTVGGSGLDVSYNASLVSLHGLEGLTAASTLNIMDNSSLTSLTALSGLTSLHRLFLQDCPLITDLAGLGGVPQLEWLSLSNNAALQSLNGLAPNTNPALTVSIGYSDALVDLEALSGVTTAYNIGLYYTGITNVDGLRSLTHVNGLFLSESPYLVSLSGLAKLTTVDERLGISSSTVLTTLAGLEGVTRVGGLLLEDNERLTDLHALSAVTSIPSVLSIHGNRALSACEIEWLQTNVGPAHLRAYTDIRDNAPGTCP